MKQALQEVLRPLDVKENMVIAVAHLDAVTEEERAAIFHLYCAHCGRQQPWHPAQKGLAGMRELGCQCWNDE